MFLKFEKMSDITQAIDMDPIKSGAKRSSFGSWKGNKYPSVKLRGFYSEVASNQNAEKAHVTSI